MLRFFQFYCQEFDHTTKLINISSRGECFLDKEIDYDSLFHESLKAEHMKYSYYFLVRDPFNNTYNPAKNYRYDDYNRVTSVFRSAVVSLLEGTGFEFLD